MTQIDMKLEALVIPVLDVDRAKRFYANLGWRLDADFPFDNGFRIVQFTPPGSGCSVQFGTKITPAAPGSAHGLYLIVGDIQAARDELVARGVNISEVFHAGTPGAQFQPDGTSGRLSGPAPDHASYSSFARFPDPDGNTWLLQQVTTRLPGRIDPGDTSFASANDLASALRRAEAAHGEHEKRTGQRDENWPKWYAAYMLAEQAGQELPNETQKHRDNRIRRSISLRSGDAGHGCLAGQVHRESAERARVCRISRIRVLAVVSTSHHDPLMAAILANPVMIKACQAGAPGNGKPFPDGSKLAKIHWNPKKMETFPAATVPGTQHDMDFMVKDSKRFADNGGWGYAVFDYDAASDTFTPGTLAGKPPQGNDAKRGFACHTMVKTRDYVFTDYGHR